MKFSTLLRGLVSLANCAISAATARQQHNEIQDVCKCFPGDACWPSEREWSHFNNTVKGRLIKTVPIGSPCHDPHYDEAECDALKSQWFQSPVQYDLTLTCLSSSTNTTGKINLLTCTCNSINSSSSVQAAIFANASCDPFTARSSACLLGNYVAYAVNVTGKDDVAATVRFAREKNIRLVIRNTAHDYMGRSTGAGALAIWTHFLKSVEIKNWSDDEYVGKAVKIGAGTQGFEVSEAVQAENLVVVTGECPTVGIAGGYTQSGGHSPLSTAFGLSADNTLEFEVLTPDGKLVTARASSPEYADLFWALSGSGAGNYGVVLSVTLRAHPDAVTSGASFTVVAPAALDAWHAALPQIIDSGTQATYAADGDLLFVHSISGYNKTQHDMEAILSPLVASMAMANISLEPSYTQFASYHDHYWHYYGPLPAGVFGDAESFLMTGRLLPRDVLLIADQAIKAANKQGTTFIGQAMNVSRFANRRRAVAPPWRDSIVMSVHTLPLKPSLSITQIQAEQDFLTGSVAPLFEKLAPHTGAYINEADYQQPDWQTVFYGSNYERLLAVKKKYDPEGLLYNAIAVGSEQWEVRKDGRMCATSTRRRRSSMTAFWEPDGSEDEAKCFISHSDSVNGNEECRIGK